MLVIKERAVPSQRFIFPKYILTSKKHTVSLRGKRRSVMMADQDAKEITAKLYGKESNIPTPIFL